MGAYLTLHKYTNKFYETNQIKNKGSPLLDSPFGAKIKNSNLQGKSAGEFSPIPPSFLIGGEGEIRTHGPLTGTLVFKTSAFDHSATSPLINSETKIINSNNIIFFIYLVSH